MPRETTTTSGQPTLAHQHQLRHHSYVGLSDTSYRLQIKPDKEGLRSTHRNTAPNIERTPIIQYVSPSWLVLSPPPPHPHPRPNPRNKHPNRSPPKAAPGNSPMDRWQNESIREAPWNTLMIDYVMDGGAATVNTYNPIQHKSRDEDDVDIRVLDVSSMAAPGCESTKGEHGSMYGGSSKGMAC
ncbi:hypothetical protein CONLIGDRAFT_689895 [Coniochaeta ligniaria NRRL 30616]|uniref:Uncharacterized protein n=1 Tax=Coniochaeta ligniaria NRRL 30616 TaxID=1408157 RepID=A0A1J7K5F3_9PEZI|nr:hypothetical protein CONLIGDRAFT_689895 [Coniochaeta ligniaria NRRL 30616]